MLLVGFPLVYTLIIVRIIMVMLIGYKHGAEAVMETTQIIGGWFLIFMEMFILLSASEKGLKNEIFTTISKWASKRAPCPNCSQSLEKKQNFCLVCGKLLRYSDIKISKRDLFKIAALAISVSLITLLEVPIFALTNGNAQVIVQSPSGGRMNAPILPEIAGYTLRFVYSNETLEKIVGSNASLTYVYSPEEKSKPKIWGTIEIADSRSVLRRREILYRAGELRGEILDLRDVQLLQNLPIIGRFVSLRSLTSDLTLVTLYWYERAVFDTGSGAVEKYAKISVLAFTNNSSNYVRIEEESLLPVGQAIASYYEPTRAWSWIALLIARYGYALTAIVIVLLAAILTVQAINSLTEKNLNLEAFSKLALQDEKIVIRAVYQAGKRGKSTANAIALSFRNLAGKSIEQNRLLETLKYAEEAGLVKRSIVDEKNEPTLVWKSQIAFPTSKPYLQRIRKLPGLDKVLVRLGY